MDRQNLDQAQSLLTRSQQTVRTQRVPITRLPGTTLCSFVVVLALASASFAQSVLVDDAYTSTAPKLLDSNFGTNPNLLVNEAGNVYIKFKLSSSLPAGTPGSAVERATLKLYLANITTPGKLDIYAINGAWDEATLTARNAPPLGNLLTTTASIELTKRHEFLVIDLTTLVRQWLGDDGQGTNGIPNHGIAILAHAPDPTTPETANITLDSKENSQTSHEARLDLFVETSSGGLQVVAHDASLTGDGTTASPLGVANGGINTAHLANDAVTSEKIVSNAVGSAQLADGAVTSPKITAPLSLTSTDAAFTLSVANTGTGPALTAAGAINTSLQYNIDGKRMLSNPGNSNLFAGEGAGGVNTSFGGAFFGYNAGLNNTSGRLNSFMGYRAGSNNTTGCCNSFFGNDAGLGNEVGRSNVFVGGSAGRRNTSGSFNTFLGDVAAWNFVNDVGTTTGGLNTFVGYASGWRNTVGNNVTLLGANSDVATNNLSFATAIGAGAVVDASNTVVLGRNADSVQVPGSLNVAGTFGANILNATTQFNIGGNRVFAITGSQSFPNTNIFTGVGAGANNSTGIFNVFSGFDAGFNNTSGGGNTFVGPQAGFSNTTGSSNAFFGNAAGYRNISGQSNSFFGQQSGSSNTTGIHNSFFGHGAGATNVDGTSNSFFGNASGLLSTGSFNSFLGASAGSNNTSGNNNTFLGGFVGAANTTGTNNTLLGTLANVGANNLNFATAIGSGAIVSTSNTIVLGRSLETVKIPGALDVTGAFNANILNAATQFNIAGNRAFTITGDASLPNSNTFVGVAAGPVNIGIGNSFFGKNSGLNNTGGGSNSFFGIDSGRANTNGIANSFFGDTAGVSNTTGGDNSFFGISSGSSNTTGSGNTFVGEHAGNSNTIGNHNAFFGGRSGNFNVIGNNNTFIGFGSGFFTANPVGFNNTLLGMATSVFSGVNNSSAVGYRAVVTQSESLVLGGITGINGGVDTNVGIGNTAPRTKLHLTGGKIYVEANGQGVILKSPGGSCFELTVTDVGSLSTTATPCP